MTWFGAQAWANNLSLGGYTDWALPTNVPAVFAYNETNSQMGDLFYNQLGGVAGDSITTTHNANYNLFTNVQNYVYWSSSEYDPDIAFHFNTTNGSQGLSSKTNERFAWAVRSGDVGVAAVPLPAATWLFLSGLIGVLGLKQRKNRA